MQIFPTIDGSIDRFDRVFYGLAGLFVRALGEAGAAVQTTKLIPGPTGLPVFRSNLSGWAGETKLYIDRELAAIHRELVRLYSVKQDD
jgi:hypothetical protein